MRGDHLAPCCAGVPASCLALLGEGTVLGHLFVEAVLWYDDVPVVTAGANDTMGLSSFDGLVRGHRKQAELRALLKRSQSVYTQTTTTHSLPNLG